MLQNPLLGTADMERVDNLMISLKVYFSFYSNFVLTSCVLLTKQMSASVTHSFMSYIHETRIYYIYT